MRLSYFLLCTIAVFSKSTTSLNSSLRYTYIGCYVDKADTQLYESGSKFHSVKMTVTMCRDFCFRKRTTYFAIQEANECRCGNDLEPRDQNDDERLCDNSCISIYKENCGGYRSSSVYTVCQLNTYSKSYAQHYVCDGICYCKVLQCSLYKGICPEKYGCAEGWSGYSCNVPDKSPQFIGCFTNVVEGAKPDIPDSEKKFAGVEKCAQECRGLKKTYTGVGNGKCNCGDSYGTYGEATKEACFKDTIKCDKNLAYQCGNQLANAVYRSCPFRHYKQDCTSVCYCADAQCSLADGNCPQGICKPGYSGQRCDQEDYCFNTPCQHNGLCEQTSDGGFICKCRLGYDGQYCQDAIDFALPQGLSGQVEQDIFNGSTMTTQPPTVNPNVPTYLGCYSESTYQGSQQIVWKINDPALSTISQCAYYCQKKLFTYAGMKDGNICQCVQSFVFGFKSSPTKCDKPCPGEAHRKCGGAKAYTVYTACTMHFYLYENKQCESRCNCFEGQCHVSTGICPDPLCMKGWTGPKCNEEASEGPETVQETSDQLKRKGLGVALAICIYAVGVTGQMILWLVYTVRRHRHLQRRKRDVEARRAVTRKGPEKSK